MRIAVPKEARPGETRVALDPESCRKLVQLGAQLAVEAGAGAAGNAASTTNAPAPAAPAAGDTATVSSVAVQLAKLGTAVDQSSGVDSAKVASLQAAISNGTYQVNSQSVADKLLATQNEGQ